MKIYGYIRVSAGDQNEDRQLIAMKNAQVPRNNIFLDKQSGCNFDRPMYRKMVKKLKRDDLIYIKSIDRLGRNYREVVEQWQYLTRVKGVDIVVIEMPLLDTRRGKDLMGTFLSDIVLQVLSFVAENERTNIRSRQREGIKAAREKGIKFGRPKKKMPEDFPIICEKWKRKEIATPMAASMCGVSRSTFYERVREYEQNIGQNRKMSN
ncbi:MAG: recombinase family protein [Lachnospiraceae bacterium]|nr:recombinase family protein [Lachnospiraceae bacterium]